MIFNTSVPQWSRLLLSIGVMSLLQVGLWHGTTSAQDPGYTVEFGGTTVGAPALSLPAFGSEQENCTLTTAPEPYVVQPLAVDSTHAYEMRVVEAIDLSDLGNTDDTILTLYADSLATDDPCLSFLALGNVVVGEGLDATLTAGRQYALVVSGFLGSEDAFRLSITGPAGRSIWLGQLGTGSDDTAATAPAIDGPYRVGSVYPNPFRDAAEFSLAVSEAQDVLVDVVDLLGRRIGVVFDGHMAAGAESPIHVDGRDWPAGIYIVRIVGKTFSDSRTVMVLR